MKKLIIAAAAFAALTAFAVPASAAEETPTPAPTATAPASPTPETKAPASDVTPKAAGEEKTGEKSVDKAGDKKDEKKCELTHDESGKWLDKDGKEVKAEEAEKQGCK